jgi:hypothetical protein
MLIAFSALVFQAAAAQPAQSAVTLPAPTPEVRAAVDTWGQCLNAGVAAVPATEAPEAAAPGVISACATQQAAIPAAIETWITSASMTAEQGTEVRRRLGTLTNGLVQRVVDRIKAVRAAPAPGR